jgi:hypothetical protein
VPRQSCHLNAPAQNVRHVYDRLAYHDRGLHTHCCFNGEALYSRQIELQHAYIGQQVFCENFQRQSLHTLQAIAIGARGLLSLQKTNIYRLIIVETNYFDNCKGPVIHAGYATAEVANADYCTSFQSPCLTTAYKMSAWSNCSATHCAQPLPDWHLPHAISYVYPPINSRSVRQG